MKVYPEKLESHLKKTLAPIYFISGEEPLQREECGDRVRKAAKSKGYSSRELYIAEGDFSWNQLVAASDALSLFSEQRLIELKIPSGKPGKAGADALKAYAERPADDAILLVVSDKLESRATNSAWYKAIDKVGVTVQVWPIKAADLPNWISQRLRDYGFEPNREVVSLLTEKVEGNLLAAKQELEKLSLLLPPGPMAVEQVMAAVSDSARYSVFDLADALLLGKPKRASRIIAGLKGEGTEPVLVLWTVLRELRALTRMALARDKGASVQQVLKAERIFSNRQGMYQKALQRKTSYQWLQLLRWADDLDLVVKGRQKGDFWLEVNELACDICGRPLRDMLKK